MLRNTRILMGMTAAVATTALMSGNATRSEAFPPFVAKEGKPCAYCHVKAEGGGKRNYRGMYYDAHGKTFAEFDDAAEAKKAGVEVGSDPDPNVKPKSWTAPKGAEATAKPAAEPKAMTVADAQAKAKTAQATYQKSPNDAKAKKTYAASVADLGRATMLDQSIPPKKRYPDALKFYRQALTLDPTNKVALEDKKKIEDVYKSMGKPIPQ